LPSTVPFVGPEAQERARGHAFVARLGANESVFGPSPVAIAAMAAAAGEGPKTLSFAPSRATKPRPRARSCASGPTNGTVDGNEAASGV
jgi:hypothetical protein